MSKTSKLLGDVTIHMLFSVIISALGPFQYGFHLAELNAPQDLIICGVTKGHVFANAFGLSNCINMTESKFAFLSSVFVIGGFVGAMVTGQGSTIYGRLKVMQLISLFFIAGSLLETISETVFTMFIGRLLIGLGAGAATVVTPLYITEISPPDGRNLCGTITQTMICLGILSTQILGYIFRHDSQWRFILVTGTGLGIVYAVFLFFIPESPAWLLFNKNSQLAKQVLQSIRSADYPIHKEIALWNNQSPTLVEEEPLITSSTTSLVSRNEPQNSITSKYNTNLCANKGIFSVLFDPLYRPAIIAVLGIMFAQQLSGINSINLYSVTLLHGVIPISSRVLAIVISAMNVITTILCAPLIYYIGRKSCLLISTIGMGVMSFILALSLVLELKLLTAFAVILFVGFFATGLGPVPFIMASELVGLEAVSATQSWCLAGNYTATFLVAQFFPLVNSWMNTLWGGTGWIFFGFAALGVINSTFIAYRVPETNGKSGPDEIWGRVKPNLNQQDD
ncbi:putative metabolite transport protein [Erysiphe neolycopersici]|uniref:Putative metabolite transport protein n=1 Tax=Erysiphe neolycopersici TaxID=212602 RepID=A0A420HQD4_9PEZI|nr:putative metabolite transport protein [Erysiphe neolycopersici]